MVVAQWVLQFQKVLFGSRSPDRPLRPVELGKGFDCVLIGFARQPSAASASGDFVGRAAGGGKLFAGHPE